MAHILVIEDDSAVQTLFGQLLEGEGYTVSHATNGAEGMSLLKQQKTDLIITDIMMPEMDGLEVIQAVQDTHPKLPIIAISGGMRAVPINFLPHAKKFGARRVFAKPVVLSDLLSAVKELLGESA